MTTNNNIKKVLIVGGGTAGWMAAAAISKFVSAETCEIQLVESEKYPTVGVGEATIPQIVVFNKTLGLDENEFIKKTQGTFKLGIEFVNWGKNGDRYMHAFGDVGRNMHSLPFHQLWWKQFQQGKAEDLGAYALNSVASYQGKFMRSVNAGDSPLSSISYAFQFDAGLYAAFLRERAEAQGVKRTEAHIVDVKLNKESGFIDSIVLEDGSNIEADLFIDCSGFKGLLIEETLHTGYEDWSHWLPADSAWAVPCARTEPLLPYTRATAHSAGWQWRIPLQHRTGNGHVFSSKYMDEAEAKNILLNNLDGEVLAEPRLIKFATGKRKKMWNKNCIALGLSSGFMEPLESTSIHLVQSAISRLMAMFPTKDFNHGDIDEFNRQMDFEYERIRDFVILHYKATERNDSEFWNYCRTMAIPETLEHKISAFKSCGNIHRFNNELFNEVSWAEVLYGQGVHPERYHPLADGISDVELEQRMMHVKSVVDKSVEYMPLQSEFIDKNCKAKVPE